ncbi:MAG: septum formation protein Maf [Gammaproteobacteria bacterium]|nr:septum formation protein Maf [Gammaproteobacteria bacterium]
MATAPPLILASTSRYRRALLERLQLPFEAVAPGVEETYLAGEAPAERARRLALAKARAVAGQRPEAAVIGSDQVAVCGASILDKPGDAARCREQLQSLSGREARFITAVAVVCTARALVDEFCDTTTVLFRSFTTEEVARYVERDRPWDCAGGFRGESLGVTLFESVASSDPTGLVGLPLIRLAASLRALGHALP